MEKFYLEQYLRETAGPGQSQGKKEKSKAFAALCRIVAVAFEREWNEQQTDMKKLLDTQKRAIIGYDEEVRFFKEKIRQFLKQYGAEEATFPPWYESLADAIYHENWGLAGIAEWFSQPYSQSSSAKVIGERIYFLENGVLVQKQQTIARERREQLIRALLLLTPEERLDRNFHEIYMLDGTRVTIFGGSMVKDGQDAMIFRRYVVPRLTFEELSQRGTIPTEAVPLFKEMVTLGYNVAFTGAMRSGKSTFLSTWQSCEDPSLEGVMVETDPEVPLHKIMEGAPIVQLLADGDALRTITKNLLRSDADYMIMAEARDGVALDTAIKIASKGTRRMKITFHNRSPEDFPYDVAGEIVKSMGGDLHYIARRVAASFDYIFHFVQLTDKSKKRLKSISELSLDKRRDKICVRPICQYTGAEDRWVWENHIGVDKESAGREESREHFERFSSLLAAAAGEKER